VGSLETAPRGSNDNMSAKTAFATGEAVLASGAAFGLSPRDELDETRHRTIADYIQQLEEFQELDDEEEVDEEVDEWLEETEIWETKEQRNRKKYLAFPFLSFI
jgi:hypothetical protein